MKEQEIERLRSQLKLLERRLRAESPPVEGLSRSAVRVLIVATRNIGGTRPKGLADELQMTSSNVAAALRELEGGGFIRRERQVEDPRRVDVLVTDTGRGLVENFRSERNTWLGQAVEAVLDEQEQRALSDAGDLLERLAAYASEGGAR
jgi:DNA-binding MarR family transcriptional regulator